MRPRTKTWPAVTALLLALALAAPAAAQEAPTLGAPSTEETTTQAPVTTTDTSDGGLATWQQALIFAAGFILLGGIAIAIVSDARQRAGGDDRAVTEGAGAPGHRHRQQAKQRAREKAKAARAQRRRNR
jgi:hypothetical protein